MSKPQECSFQSEVLALELDIPLIDLASVSQIDLAIDGADEVDPGFQLIKGGGACHVREKLVASKANQLLIVCLLYTSPSPRD